MPTQKNTDKICHHSNTEAVEDRHVLQFIIIRFLFCHQTRKKEGRYQRSQVQDQTRSRRSPPPLPASNSRSLSHLLSSPILRKIPSDPAADRRTFGLSPSPMPARYLTSEGRQQVDQQHHHHQQNHLSYNPNARHHQTPSYPRSGHGYPADPYRYGDRGAPTHIPVRSSVNKSCRCPSQQQHCSCGAGISSNGSSAAMKQHHQSSMWHKTSPKNLTAGTISSSGSSINNNAGRSKHTSSNLFGSKDRMAGATHHVSVAAPTPSPKSSSSSSAKHVSPPRQKKSDWENLLGAADLEFRAQQRAELVPQHATSMVPRYSSAAATIGGGRAPLHPNAVDNRYCGPSGPASVSPDLGPRKPTHRRGEFSNGVSGGGPAYSGSTADAACLLATLPQRMLDRASMVSNKQPSTPVLLSSPKRKATIATVAAAATVAASSPNIVSAVAPGSIPAPVRVQASGRRGPRGQSRFKGVCITRAGKWRAVIYIGRKQKYLGVFDSEFDAARAYDAAALQHFAEGAKLNFPDGIEQQLNEISNGGGSGNSPFSTAGAGGAAAPRSATPPAMEDENCSDDSISRKRQRKSAFGEQDEGEWVRDNTPWSSNGVNSSNSRRR